MGALTGAQAAVRYRDWLAMLELGGYFCLMIASFDGLSTQDVPHPRGLGPVTAEQRQPCDVRDGARNPVR